MVHEQNMNRNSISEEQALKIYAHCYFSNSRGRGRGRGGGRQIEAIEMDSVFLNSLVIKFMANAKGEIKTLTSPK